MYKLYRGPTEIVILKDITREEPKDALRPKISWGKIESKTAATVRQGHL